MVSCDDLCMVSYSRNAQVTFVEINTIETNHSLQNKYVVLPYFLKKETQKDLRPNLKNFSRVSNLRRDSNMVNYS